MSISPSSTSDSSAVDDRASIVWSPATRIAFRFIFVLMALMYLPWPFFPIPAPPFAGAYNWFITGAYYWVTTSVLRLDGEVWGPFIGLSAEYGFDGFRAAVLGAAVSCAFAAIVTVIWTALDRRRLAYPRLHEWMRLVIRASLIMGLFNFGMAKIIPTQTPFPGLGKLMVPLGATESVAGGIPWTLVGISGTYAVFTGLAEFGCGLLLCFRRTTPLGAILTVGVMSHVLAYIAGGMITYQMRSYIFPAAVLAAPEVKRLVDLLWFRRPTMPRVSVPLFTRRSWSVAGRAIGVAYCLYAFLWPLERSLHRRAESLVRPPLWGIYQVDEFERGGQIIPPALTDSTRLERLIIAVGSGSGNAAVRFMSGPSRTYSVEVDTAAARLTLRSIQPPRPTVMQQERAKRGSAASQAIIPTPERDTIGSFAYSQPDSTTLVLSGTLGADSVRIRLRRLDERTFPLVRGSWPFDRAVLNARFTDE